jgi:hypothetical protein
MGGKPAQEFKDMKESMMNEDKNYMRDYIINNFGFRVSHHHNHH